jgi:putative spermidine/putrescine transport system substrate-binding protein
MIWDESSAEAVAKLRAMNEAGNITWDSSTWWPPTPSASATKAWRWRSTTTRCSPRRPTALGLRRFRRFDHLRLLHPADRLLDHRRLPHRRREWAARTPTTSARVRHSKPSRASARWNKRPINNMEWALLCDGVAKEDVYDVLETEEGVAQAFAKLDTIKDETVWWSAGAETPQLLADGEVVIGSTYNGRLFSAIEEQGQPVGCSGTPGARPRRLDHPEGLPEDRLARGDGLPQLRHGHAASRRPGASTSPTARPAPPRRRWSAACRTRHRHGAAHADRPGQRQERLPVTTTNGGPTTATTWTPSSRPGWRSKR